MARDAANLHIERRRALFVVVNGEGEAFCLPSSRASAERTLRDLRDQAARGGLNDPFGAIRGDDVAPNPRPAVAGLRNWLSPVDGAGAETISPAEAAAVLGFEGGSSPRKIPWHAHVGSVYAAFVAVKPDVSDAEVIRRATTNWPKGLKRPTQRTLERFMRRLREAREASQKIISDR